MTPCEASTEHASAPCEGSTEHASAPAPLVVVGDTLCDVDVHGTVSRRCPDASAAPVLDADRASRRPGGAGLAALLAASSGVPVRLVTALADDEDGDWLAGVLGERVRLVAGPARGSTSLKVRLLDRGRPLVRVDHGSGTAGEATCEMVDALDDASAVLVADYGRGVSADPELAKALAARCGDILVVWDPHPRGATPVPGCAMVTPNLAEARRAVRPRELPADPVDAAIAAARLLPERWYARAAAVTAGAHGAAVAGDRLDAQLLPASVAPEEADPCGAGDCFAATLAVALRAGADPVLAVATAVARASEFVRAGGAGSVRLDPDPALGRRVRRLPNLLPEGVSR
jgi:D-beta-D-heptose 7-phosphate kinase / D-beta-D-heptose 1-phosphate adenosyltransferase